MVFRDDSNLGTATLNLDADLTGLQKGLKAGETATEKSTGEMSKGWKGLQSNIQESVSEIPIIGDRLAGLVTPAGAATLAIGGLASGLIASVKHVVDLERELRPMIERSGLAAEELQILTNAAERLGSEDGLEGVTDAVQELQLRLSEATLDMSGPAVEALEKLQLSAEDLKASSPAEAFDTVVEALQNLESEYDKKFIADELMGGASEKLSGIINAQSDEYAALRQEIAETHDIISTQALASAKEFDDNMTELTQTLDSAKTTIGNFVIPVLNDFADAARQDIDELKEMKDAAVESFGAMSGAAAGWQVEMEPVREIIPELGEDFEDFATTVLEASDSTFNKETPGSFPYMIDDGMNTAVQVTRDSLLEMNNEFQRMVEANRAQVSREEQLELRRAELRRKGNEAAKERAKAEEEAAEDIVEANEEIIEVIEKVAAAYDETYEDLENYTDDFLRDALKGTDEWIKASLKAHEDAQYDRLKDQLAAYDKLEDAQEDHHDELEDAEEEHLKEMVALQTEELEKQLKDSRKEQRRLEKEHTDELLKMQERVNKQLQEAVDEANRLEMEKAEEFWDRYYDALKTAKEEETELIRATAIEQYNIQQDLRNLEMTGLRELRAETFDKEVEGHRTRSDIAMDLHMLRVRGIRDEESLGTFEELMRELWTLSQAQGGITRLNDAATGRTTRVYDQSQFETFLQSQLDFHRSGIPALHDGGIITAPTLGVLHPEEVVLPLDRLPEILDRSGMGMGGSPVIVNVNEGAYVFDDFPEMVQDALRDIERRGIA